MQYSDFLEELEEKEAAARLGSPVGKLFVRVSERFCIKQEGAEGFAKALQRVCEAAKTKLPPMKEKEKDKGKEKEKDQEKAPIEQDTAQEDNDEEEGGDPDAQCFLAKVMELGRGLSVNERKAVSLYRKAAGEWKVPAGEEGIRITEQNLAEFAGDSGRAVALCVLGLFYDDAKISVPKDPKKAIEYFQRAAALGNSAALNNLGM